jgi:integrase/recombinase XerD
MSNVGIPLRIIQEISGHNNLEQLQHYERGEAGSSQRSVSESFHAFLHQKSFDSIGKPQRHSHLTSITKRSLPALPVLPVLTSVV